MRYPSASMVMLLVPVTASAHDGSHAAMSSMEILNHLLLLHAACVTVGVLAIALWQGYAQRRQSQRQPAGQPRLVDDQCRKVIQQ